MNAEFFRFRVKIGVDDFMVGPQSSTDLESWQSLALPSQAESINPDGSLSYQIPLEGNEAAKFMRLLITPRP
jgi:hypothetical protein